MWIVSITLGNGTHRPSQVLKMTGSHVDIEMFEGTSNTNKRRTNCKFTGNVPTMGVSEEMLGQSFNGSSKVIASSPNVLPETGLPHDKVGALIAHQASFVQLKDPQDIHEDNFTTVFWVMGVNTETA